MAVKSRRGVLLTTYGMILHNAAALTQGLSKADENKEPLWDILILDEVGCSHQKQCLFDLLIKVIKQKVDTSCTSSQLNMTPRGGFVKVCAMLRVEHFRKCGVLIVCAVDHAFKLQACLVSTAHIVGLVFCSELAFDVAFMQGHKIKNPRTQLAQRLREIPVRLPVIISGTPIQNDLMEMHALIDFTCPVRSIPLLASPDLCTNEACSLDEYDLLHVLPAMYFSFHSSAAYQQPIP